MYTLYIWFCVQANFRGLNQEKAKFVKLILFWAFFSKFAEKPVKTLFRGIYFRGFDKIKNFAGT